MTTTATSAAGAPGRFDFGLSAAQEARAAKLHVESIVFDMLSQHAGGNIFSCYPEELQADFRARVASAGSRSDALAEAIYWPFEVATLGKSDLLRAWLQRSGLTCGTYDVDVVAHDRLDPLSCNWEERICRYAQLSWLRYVTTAAQIRQAKRDGVVALYANFQPVIPAPRDLGAFDTAYGKGLRSCMLTYNRMDHVGVGCTERVDAGLSMFGIEVVAHCNDIGMIVDVSHCGHLTTIDACRHSRKPVTANHTAARSLYGHARGKSDDALRAIAVTGGVIGVVAVPAFLTAATDATIEHMLDHIDYISDLVGPQHVGIGTDWPLQAPDDVLLATFGAELQSAGFRPQDRLDLTNRLIGFDDCRDLPNITRGLVKRGYTDEQIRGILGENALRVFEEVCGG
ncbi:MAG: dipeptidase [Steroidobacteraceae bacterium]